MAYKSKFMQEMEQQGKISAAQTEQKQYKSKFFQSGGHLGKEVTPAPMRSPTDQTFPTAAKPETSKPTIQEAKSPTALANEAGASVTGRLGTSLKPSAAYMAEISGLQVQEAQNKLNEAQKKKTAAEQRAAQILSQRKDLETAAKGIQELRGKYEMSRSDVDAQAYLLAMQEYQKQYEAVQENKKTYEKESSAFAEYDNALLKYEKVRLQNEKLLAQQSEKQEEDHKKLWQSGPVEFIDRTLSAIQAGQTDWLAGVAQIDRKIGNAALHIVGSQLYGVAMATGNDGLLKTATDILDQSKTESEDAAAAMKASKDYMAEALQGTGKVDGWIIQQMQSVGSMMMDMMAAGSTSAMGLPEGADTGKIMAIRAAGSGMLDAQEKGYSETEQILVGIANGALEYASEQMFGGNPIYDTDKGWVTAAVEKAVKNPKITKLMYSKGFDILSEGLEEVFTEFVEPIAEGLLTSGDIEMASAEDLANAFAGGMFLSLTGQGASVVVREVSGAGNAERSAGRFIRNANAVQELVNEGLEADPKTEAYQQAAVLKKKLDAGKKISNAEVGRLLYANQEAIDAGLLTDSEMEPDQTAPEGALRDPETGYFAIETQTEAGGKVSYQLAQVQEDGKIQNIGEPVGDLMAAKRAAQAQGMNVRNMGAAETLRDTAERIATAPAEPRNDSNNQNIVAVNAADNKNTGLRWAGNEEGVYDYGTEQRNMGTGADQERVGGYAAEPTGRSTRQKYARATVGRAEEASRIRRNVQAAGGEVTSLRELGVKIATEDTFVTEVPREAWTERVRGAYEAAESEGLRFVPVIGTMEVETESGTARVNGVFDPETGTIYARADAGTAYVDETTIHEVFHFKASQDPELVGRVRAYLLRTYTEEQLQEMAGRYYEGFQDVYSGRASDEALEELIWEEMLADAYAEYQRYRDVDVTEFAADVQEAVWAGREQDSGDRKDQTERTSKESAFQSEEIYTYEALVSKPDMVVTMVQERDLPTKGKRYDTGSISAEARSKAITLENADGFSQKYVYVKDLGANVLTPKDGFVHGITGNKTNGSATRTAEVTYDLTRILENSIAVNEETSRGEKDGLYSYILFGYAKRESDGREYLVKTTVNHFGINKSIVDTVEIYDVLKGSKAKIVEPSVIGSHAGEPAASVLDASGSTTISVAELLETVKENYPEFLPDNIREHFGIEEAPKAPNLRYSTASEDGENLYRDPDMADEEYEALNTAWKNRKRRRDAEKAPETAAEIIIPKNAFRSTPAMDKLGIKIDGSVTRYRETAQLRAYNDAAEKTQRMLNRRIRKLNATKQEMDLAKLLVSGSITADALNTDTVNVEVIAELADYLFAAQSFNEDRSMQRRSEINTNNLKVAKELFQDSEAYHPQLPGRLAGMTKLVMNERTPERVVKQIFGTEQGEKIYETYFRPVWVNGAEMNRFENRMLKRVEAFKDQNDRTRPLTEKEREFAQRLMEGEAVRERMENLAKEDPDARERIEAAAQNVNNGMDYLDAVRDQNIQEEEHQGLVQAYADYMDTVTMSQDLDQTILWNAIREYQQIYNEMYEAMNDFLVSHGYKAMGFIKGYAPHFQKREVQQGLFGALKALGVEKESVTELPASIAGRTADFKPNMKWNPHMQSRKGETTSYDIQMGFEQYLHYAAEMFYHTDDVMRIRQAVNWMRGQYSGEEISQEIQDAEVDRFKSVEWKRDFLIRKEIIRPQDDLDGRAIDMAYQEYVDGLFERVKPESLKRYSEFVTWLDNYANIVAGKQSLADRGLEYGGGRTALNMGSKLMRRFASANVAGNISSVLNQSAQLPLLQKELKGYLELAMFDLARGSTRKENFAERSDFLTDKRGVEKLTTDNREKFISGLFKPAEMMDRMVSTLAVRGRYRQALAQNMTPEEAMKAADDFGRRVMGSRMKGARPLGFESKTFVNQMLHVFQLEASNTFDYMWLSDMPQAVREVRKTKGKAAAARYTAAAVLGYLINAFLLNTITDELYGGSPAPFDVIGWMLNFVAGGWGRDDEEFVKTVIDNAWERAFGERPFETEPIDREEGFQWAGAADDLSYNIWGDVPYVRNALGLAGVGDQSLPTVGINEFFEGLRGAGKTIWNQATKGQEETGLDWAGAAAEAGESLGSALVQVAPGGRQLRKSAQGIRAMIQGGKYSGWGENAKLQYPVDQNAWNVIRAGLFGLSALDETDAFYAGEKALTAAQTQKAKELETAGVDIEQTYGLYQEFAEINSDLNRERIGSIEAKQLKRDLIDSMDLTDEQKLEVYMQTMATGSDRAKANSKAKYETLLGEGVSWSQITSLENDYASFNEDADDDGEADMDSLERGIAKRNAIAALDLTDEQKLAVFDEYHLDKDSKNYEATLDEFHAMLDAGLNWDDVTAAHNTFATLNTDEELNATQKATEYAKWADEQGWTAAQKTAVKDRYTFWQMIPAEATSYEKFTGAGLNSDNADKVTKILAELEPEAGRESVSTVQKLEAIAKGGFSAADERKAMRGVMTEEQAAEFDDLMDAGLTPKQYAQYRRAVYGLTSDKDADGKTISGSKKKKVLEAIDRLPISDALKTKLYYAEGYSESTLDDAPWY